MKSYGLCMQVYLTEQYHRKVYLFMSPVNSFFKYRGHKNHLCSRQQQKPEPVAPNSVGVQGLHLQP